MIVTAGFVFMGLRVDNLQLGMREFKREPARSRYLRKITANHGPCFLVTLGYLRVFVVSTPCAEMPFEDEKFPLGPLGEALHG